MTDQEWQNSAKKSKKLPDPFRKQHWLHVALYQPEIPQNTGNIIRLCASTNVCLHIIEPCGFSLADSRLKRAGLHYWGLMPKVVHRDWQHFLDFWQHSEVGEGQTGVFSGLSPVTTFGYQRLNKARLEYGSILLFGNESQGLPAAILDEWAENSIVIPQWGVARSLNLANSVAITVYEAARRFEYNPD